MPSWASLEEADGPPISESPKGIKMTFPPRPLRDSKQACHPGAVRSA